MLTSSDISSMTQTYDLSGFLRNHVCRLFRVQTKDCAERARGALNMLKGSLHFTALALAIMCTA